jgi:glycosyltransferase involved in cell wall biosynthesis
VSNNQTPPSLKVAIVQDWLIGGGAERVVTALHAMYPEAPIYASYCTDEWRARLEGKVVTGFLQHWPFSRLRKFLPLLRIWWFAHLDLSSYDLILSSSSSGEAKAVRPAKGAIHVNYCHAPTHFYWTRYESYLERPGFGSFDPLAQLGLRLLVGPLRRWDYNVMQRPDYLIANSTYTQAGIKQYYHRDSTVIHPPVDTTRFQSKEQPRRGFVIAGRQTPYKRIDLAVEACSKLGLPLTVIGKGPDHERLRRLAGSTVAFLTAIPDEQMADYFAHAEAFLFPGIDDFGVVAVEALAAGTPVIAYKGGGALDYITEGETGVFFTEQTVDSMCQALQECGRMKFDHHLIRRRSERFSPERFTTDLQTFIQQVITKEVS